MDIRIVDTEGAFWSLRQEWNHIFEEARLKHVCLSFAWFWSWWAAFGRGHTLYILLAYDEHELLGIAPLMLCRGKVWGVPVKKVQFIYNDNAPCADFLIRKEAGRVIPAFLEHLFRHKELWDVMALDNIPDDSENNPVVLRDLARRGIPFLRREGLRSPYMAIDSDWQSYCKNRGRKFLKTLRNISNRMLKAGVHQLECIRDYDAADAAFNDMVDVSGRSWKKHCGKDLLGRTQDRVFFKELCRMFGGDGALRIWLLRLDGQAIAYEFHLAHNGEVYALKSDFDASLKGISPGTYLDTQITKHYFDARIKVYDLCGHDDEEYKRRWTGLTRNHSVFRVYQPTLFGRLLYRWDNNIMYPLKESLKKQRIVMRMRRFIIGRG